ncbi:hypothetical protein N665_0913s0006 [Sinapis alba]|nr:hypothetical protein N665_0913s0006 [Sinapis alba]KAF8080940.1 hypothetical protein N665_0913s0006 [Sinapis alba]
MVHNSGSEKFVRIRFRAFENIGKTQTIVNSGVLHPAKEILVFLPSSIRSLNKLKVLRMSGCTRLEFLPSDVNLASLNYLNLTGCARLRSFPRISSNISRLFLGGTDIVEDKDCFFISNISGLTELVWSNCPMRYMPSDFCAEYLVELIMPGTKLVKLWEGVQDNGFLSRSENLKEIPNLLKATNLEYFDLNECKSLVMLKLNMKGCTSLDLTGCSRLRSFPQISTSISVLLYLDHTWIENLSELTTLTMSGCKRLINVSTKHFSECGGVKEFSDAEVPTYFIHRAGGSNLLIALPQRSLSQKIWGFKACIILEPPQGSFCEHWGALVQQRQKRCASFLH